MRRRVLLVGGGRVGRHTAEGLTSERYQITIVERDEKKCERLDNHEVSRVVCGDGTDVEILEEGGIDDADIVAGLTNDTDTNRTVAEHAREHANDARTLVRIASDAEMDLGHLAAIDNIVYPAAAGAKLAVEEISKT